MAEQISSQGQKPPQTDPAFMRVLAAVALYAFAAALFLFSLALMKDVQTLRDAPEIVWNWLCGRPDPDGPALPLMLTFSTLALLGGLALTGWHLWLRRRERI